MNRRALLTLLVVVSGCGGIPAVNTETISTVPASPAAFNEAKEAVRACAALPDETELFDRFEAIGYWAPPASDVAPPTQSTDGKTWVLGRVVSHDTGDVIVQASRGYCYVGLRGMTPQQSYELAQILVTKFHATTNAENGDGLSDHVVQAWQVQQKGTANVLIAAHKTWPWDRGRWPSGPGAAVTLMTR